MEVYDLILRDCLLYDGSGIKPYRGDLGLRNGMILNVLPRVNGDALKEIHCEGLAVSPGFINLHSWAAQDLLSDGCAMSDILQGVTMEVFGESWSEGPLSPAMKEYLKEFHGISETPWTSLSDFLTFLEEGVGVSVNIASYVGIDNLRYHTTGMDSRKASIEELSQMAALLESEMMEGAMGLGSALIYVPGLYFQTHELRTLASVAFKYGGAYISHIRSEGNQFIEALEEFLNICEGGKGILYHFKIQGQKNWWKLERGLQRIMTAQKNGTQIGACVYPYTAGMTSLSNVLPPWAREGGKVKILETIAKPDNRERLKSEMVADQDEWENLYVLSGGAEGTRVLALESTKYKKFNGTTLAEIAAHMGKSSEDMIIDLLLEENSHPMGIFFNSSEDNLQKILRQPWVCLGSDAGSINADAEEITHPRAFGTFVRFLGHYCQDLELIPLEEGIRRITSLPANLLGIDNQRGYLRPGYAADIVIFDPNKLVDKATYETPMKYAVGVRHVIVNGQIVVENGEHTGAKPGQFVRNSALK